MNERIKELYDQALETKFDYGAGAGVKPGEYYSNYITVLNPEKFAELIVQECCDWIDGSPTSESGCQLLLTKSFIIANLKGHFGV